MRGSDTRASDEAALKKIDNDWSKAAGSKNLDKTVSYYADNATVLPPNSPALTNKGSIQALWKSFMGSPGFSGGWNATKVEVAHSGDLGYVTGTYEFTQNDAAGKPTTDKGKYLEVWKKQTDGSWKCIADMFSSNLPATPAPAEKKQSPSK